MRYGLKVYIVLILFIRQPLHKAEPDLRDLISARVLATPLLLPVQPVLILSGTQRDSLLLVTQMLW